MALPIINTPTFEITIPSTKKKVKFRQFLVKEEKALLIAQQSGETSSMLHTLKDIIRACSNDKLEVESLSTFDIEYIFCQLRAKSVGEIVELVFNCLACKDPKGTVKIPIDISSIEVNFPKNHTKNIKITDTIGMNMKYPSFELLDKIGEVDKNDIDAMFDVVISSIDSIYDDSEVYPAKDQSKSDLKQFIDNLTQDQFSKVQEFFNTIPSLEKTIEFKCPNCGHEHKEVLKGLNSFF